MLYSSVCSDTLSRLGFGTMRLPLLPGGGDGDLDYEKINEMVELAMAGGINYFDTAYPYHDSKSEGAIGAALAKYPRESFRLATKFPGHQIADSYNPGEIFEEQLKRCGVDYFDYYLLHNVNENSVGVYLDKRWGILEYFDKQRSLGRIKHLGMSTHAEASTIEKFLDDCGIELEFVQIQLNYLDWSLQNAKDKYEILTKRNIPVWVMEPVRGGRLANLNEEHSARLKAMRPEESIAAWGFRFLQELPNVAVVLSGMSSVEQMRDNLKTFSDKRPLKNEERGALFTIADELKAAVPCTGCRYCTKGCPMQLDIPYLIAMYNETRFSHSINLSQKIDALGERTPTSCIGCGACAEICPQRIDIPALMPKMAEAFAALPSWKEICRKRAEAAAKSK